MIKRIYAFSDLHNGANHDPDYFSKFVDMCLCDDDCEVIGVGDILELQNSTFQAINNNSMSFYTLQKLLTLGRNKKTRLVPGNHDFDIAKYSQRLYPIEIMPLEFEYKNILFLHGHQSRFDVTTTTTQSALKIIRPLMPSLYKKLYGTPQELKERNPKQWDNNSSMITGHVLSEAFKNNKTIIFGHTHRPLTATHPEGITIGNAGDFQEECSFIKIDLTVNPPNISTHYI